MRECLTTFGVALLAAGLLSGCVTFGISETARTTPPGGFHFTGTLTPAHYTVTPDAGGTGLFFVFPAVKAKFGLAPRLDMGIDWAFGPGLGLNLKSQFLAGQVDAAVHIAGSLYGIAVPGASLGIYEVSPRVIVSGEDPDRFPFCLHAGVKYLGVGAGADGESATGGTLSGVGGFGLPFRLGSSRSVMAMPELSVSVPFLSTYSGDGESESEILLEGFVLSLGICFGYVGPDE